MSPQFFGLGLDIYHFELIVDIVKVDALARQKNSQHHLLKDVENSFHEVTHIGLEPHQFF